MRDKLGEIFALTWLIFIIYILKQSSIHHPSIHVSIYSLVQQIITEHSLCDRPWGYNNEAAGCGLFPHGTPAIGISSFSNLL